MNVDHSMEVMSEETFGPVVGIMKVRVKEGVGLGVGGRSGVKLGGARRRKEERRTRR